MFRQKDIGQISKNYKRILILLFLGFLFFLFFIKFKNTEKVLSGEVIISYSQKGFFPSDVLINKGTKVIFKNVSGQDFWPASDFYPNNGNYPGFDPKAPIKNGGDWAFVFDKVGEWGYHNHLYPLNRGTIRVSDGNFLSPSNVSCKNIDKLNYDALQICLYYQIKTEIKKGGVVGALNLLLQLYEKYPTFAAGCHDATHLIGDAAYREFRSGKSFDFGKETTYCGYGFYHGFIEAMLYTTGDYSEVRNFCESINNNLKGDVESSNAIYSCYHGIGHSTFDTHDVRLWGNEEKMISPAITTCEKVTAGLETEKIKQCATGVFNALGNAYLASQYNLKMNPKDPTWICRTQKQLYKGPCFLDTTMAWTAQSMGGLNYDFKEAAIFIEGLKDEVGEKAAMYTMASDYTRLHLNTMDYKVLVANCESVKSSLYDSCINGTLLGLLSWGKPGEEYKNAILLCGQTGFTKTKAKSCFKYLLPQLRTMYSKEKNNEICSLDIDPDYRIYCKQ